MPSTFLKVAVWDRLAPLLVHLIKVWRALASAARRRLNAGPSAPQSPNSCRTKRHAAMTILSFLHRINQCVRRAA
jgi:hypothetical protein